MNASVETITKSAASKVRDVAADIEQLQADMKTLGRAIVDRGRGGLAKAKDETADQLEAWRDDVRHMAADLQERGTHQFEAAKRQVRDKPLASLLIAFGVGLLVSHLIDRR